MNKRGCCAALMLALMFFGGAALAQTAVVDNGSDPGSRLNMRSAPSREASSVGRFSSGTRVQVLADAGEGWAEVTIGSGSASVHGYMMAAYLRDDASGVLDAREERSVVSPYGTPSVVLRDRPSDSYGAVAMLPVGERVTVIGVSGDFCYVQRSDGAVGCLAGDELR